MRSVLLAFAMFSRLPLPGVSFSDAGMRYLMAAFPLVGALVGLAVAGWGGLCGLLDFGPFLRGVGVALAPVAVTGGIHLDGLSDTADALATHGGVEKKQAVLKDPHIGSFAVVALFAYLMAFAALGAEGTAGEGFWPALALAFVLSRCLAGLAVLIFPVSPASSLAGRFRAGAAVRTSVAVLLGVLAGVVTGMIWLAGSAGLAAAAGALGLFALWRRVAIRQFGGMTGDLAGALVQLCELASLAALVVTPRLLERIQA